MEAKRWRQRISTKPAEDERKKKLVIIYIACANDTQWNKREWILLESEQNDNGKVEIPTIDCQLAWHTRFI